MIGDKISKAIKEGKWLHVVYLNKNGENTSYWIAVLDIDIQQQKLKVKIFNQNKSLDIIITWIYFNKIISADVIDFSSYETPSQLLDKIENNIEDLSWLNYDHFSNNILYYYEECSYLDNDPSQKKYTTISGIDLRNLVQNKKYVLTDEQTKKIIQDIYFYDINNTSNYYYTLAFNRLAIDENKNKFIICYNILTFDPSQKALILDTKFRFNQSFVEEGRRHSLFNYIRMDVDEFIKNFNDNYDECISLITANLRPTEKIDTMPYIMMLERNILVNIADTYNTIDFKYKENTLPTPLKSFFGNISKRNNIRKKEPSLIIYDNKININQIRVLYNAIKYPVTYVQGPPGTGKTQTILNVILSSFYNDKVTLICSSNNKPVDGIVEKLRFKYRDEEISFPYLRLGNRMDVSKATLKIFELYNFNTNKEPNDILLNKIKDNSDETNKVLIELLNRQEQREDIINCLENSTKLINSFNGKTSGVIETVKKKIRELEISLSEIPEISNDEITKLFIPLTQNYYLSQYLYYKSLQYIIKLKKPRYKELIEICSITDEDQRVNEFNAWTRIDTNMKLLTEVFPVIFSTNISTTRLGTPNFMFDLVIMDEAGQCNVATALIPITKAESLLLVGDPNQLKPVIVIEEDVNQTLLQKYNVPEKYNYKNHSILDVMIENDNISKYILLKYHYRCGKRIINFSNQRYYKNTLNLSYLTNEGNLEVIDVKNINSQQKNEALAEATAIIDYIERNEIKDAYIITPFVNQRDLILNMLSKRNIQDIGCGTIHSMQGAEKGTIIFSPAISPKTSKKTFEWIKNNYELINVAITRAKNKLVIAADTESINALSDKNDDLYNLIEYAKANGQLQVPANELVSIEIGKSNGSAVEDEFFKTISHFCSCHKTYEAERNVKLTKLFKDQLPNSQMEFDLVLYERISFFSKKPVIIFEINGGEHLGNAEREHFDKLKMDICKKRGIKLIIIPNSFIKAYEYIADIILSSKDKTTTIQQSLFKD